MVGLNVVTCHYVHDLLATVIIIIIIIIINIINNNLSWNWTTC